MGQGSYPLHLPRVRVQGILGPRNKCIFSIDIPYLPIYTLYMMRMTETKTGQGETKTMNRIEAYGVKGKKITTWHRTFTTMEDMVAWAERNNAYVSGWARFEGSAR